MQVPRTHEEDGGQTCTCVPVASVGAFVHLVLFVYKKELADNTADCIVLFYNTNLNLPVVMNKPESVG